MQIISKKAPRLRVFICNGKGNLKEDGLPLSTKEVDVLIEDCKKYAEIGTPLILAYLSNLLTEKQKSSMESLANSIPNLFLIDYNDFAQSCKDLLVGEMETRRIHLTEDEKKRSSFCSY